MQAKNSYRLTLKSKTKATTTTHRTAVIKNDALKIEFEIGTSRSWWSLLESRRVSSGLTQSSLTEILYSRIIAFLIEHDIKYKNQHQSFQYSGQTDNRIEILHIYAALPIKK